MVRWVCGGLLVGLVATVGWAESPDQAGSRKAMAEAATALDVGEPGPEWLVSSETYAFGYRPEDWEALAQSRVAFITHCPVNRDFFERCHGLGIRCFPYITLYQGIAGTRYEGLRLAEHPEYIEVDAEGNLKRSGFWESEDAKNMYVTCPNVAGYQDAMVAWVRQILELGADGVFVDNLADRAPCYGPKYGKHQHIYPDQNQAFAELLGRVRAEVRRYKPEGAVLGNSANPTTLPHLFWKHLDAEMLESYICTWVSTDRWFDWKDHWNKAGQDLQPLVRAGKQIQALSYLGHTGYGVREDAFFCYASARLAGFVWNGGRPLSDPDTADLYRLRLGRALTDERVEGEVHYRVFERGFVAVNPGKDQSGQVTLGPPMPTGRLLDLFGGGAAAWTAYGAAGYASDAGTRQGGVYAIACAQGGGDGASGAAQAIELNQQQAAPFVVSGWSRAENVSDGTPGDYSLYADVVYADGTYLYGQTAPFRGGTHDWEQASVTVKPEKPAKSVTLYALLRNRTGRAWFDGVSLRDAEGTERVRNGGFEEVEHRGRMVEAEATGAVMVPAYSGRVYLFAPDPNDAVAAKGCRLRVVTSPLLGAVRFRVDGFDYWTHSGSWTTEYVLGPRFGTFEIVFDQPGRHSVEVVDVVPADMATPTGYSSGERLGTFMDPSNPTQPSAGRKFRFREWQGLGTTPGVALDVPGDTTVTAQFDVEEAAPAP